MSAVTMHHFSGLAAPFVRSKGTVSGGVFKWNGYQFQLEQNELADMFIGIADGTKDETELRYWINDHIE